MTAESELQKGETEVFTIHWHPGHRKLICRFSSGLIIDMPFPDRAIVSRAVALTMESTSFS